MPPPLPLHAQSSPNACLTEKYNYASKLSHHSPLAIFHLTDWLQKASFLISKSSFHHDSGLPNRAGSVEDVGLCEWCYSMTFKRIQCQNGDIQIIRKTKGLSCNTRWSQSSKLRFYDSEQKQNSGITNELKSYSSKYWKYVLNCVSLCFISLHLLIVKMPPTFSSHTHTCTHIYKWIIAPHVNVIQRLVLPYHFLAILHKLSPWKDPHPTATTWDFVPHF